jgi:hypothetical protein
MRILSFDPGSKNTGIALIDTESTPILKSFWTTRSKKELVKFLREEAETGGQLDLILIEDYINRPKGSGGFDHNWDKGATHRVIGVIEATAIAMGIKVEFTKASDKAPNYGIVGMTYVKGKAEMHHWDAITHAYGYCLRKKLADPSKIMGAFAGGKA